MVNWLLVEAFAYDASASNFPHSISLTPMLLNSIGGSSAIESGTTVQTNAVFLDLHVTAQEV